MKVILVKNTTIIDELYIHNYAYEKTNEFMKYVFNLSPIRDEDTFIKIDRDDIFDEVMTKLFNSHNFTRLEQDILDKAIGEKIEIVGGGIEQALLDSEMVIADYGEFVLLA